MRIMLVAAAVVLSFGSGPARSDPSEGGECIAPDLHPQRTQMIPGVAAQEPDAVNQATLQNAPPAIPTLQERSFILLY
jgi:hypothetical protein